MNKIQTIVIKTKFMHSLILNLEQNSNIILLSEDLWRQTQTRQLFQLFQNYPHFLSFGHIQGQRARKKSTEILETFESFVNLVSYKVCTAASEENSQHDGLKIVRVQSFFILLYCYFISWLRERPYGESIFIAIYLILNINYKILNSITTVNNKIIISADLQSENPKMNVSEYCHVCKQHSDQMLMLACVHDICTNCAASAYAEQVYIRKLNPEVYFCEICSEITPLDSSSVSELNILSKSFVRVPTSINHSRTVKKNQKVFGAPMSPSPQENKKQLHSPSKKTTYFCTSHSQQQISYYCFNCQQTICPQCAIHGAHKDHNMKLIKKAISDVRSEYLNTMNSISSSQNSMSKYKDTFLRSIKQCNDRYTREKNIVTKQFDLLRTQLGTKEKQILKRLQEIKKHNIQTLTSFLEEINVNYDQISKVKKSVELVLRKDQVLIFQDYKKISQFTEKVDFINKQTESISGEIKVLNHEYFHQEIASVNEGIIKLKESFKQQQIYSHSLHPNGNKSRVSRHSQVK